MKRGEPLKRKTELARSEMKRKPTLAKPKKRTGTKAPARWQAIKRGRCAVCRSSRMVQAHHVCYRQHVAREGGDEYDPRNGMPLCHDCHAAHHQRVRTIDVAQVPAAAIAFAVELLGRDRAVDYFTRYYSGTDAGRFPADA